MVTRKYTNMCLCFMVFPQNVKIITLPEANIASESRPSQKEMSCSIHWISEFLLWVSGRVNIFVAKRRRNQLSTNILSLPGDSIRDLLIPGRWRSPTTFPFGSRFHSPSQKRSRSRNCQVSNDQNPCDIPMIYWLAYGDPFNGLL